MNIWESLQPAKAIFRKRPPSTWYSEYERDSDSLLIVLGDSWTWGDSLGTIPQPGDDQAYRVKHIYGHLLAEKLGYDFINIAFPGGSNTKVYNKLVQCLGEVHHKYKHIQIVFTLTETGRELDKDQTFLDDSEHSTVRSLLEHFENVMFCALQDTANMYSNVDLKVARNFTYSYSDNKEMLGDMHLDKTWVDCLAENQDIIDYPSDIRFMTGMVLNPLNEILKLRNMYSTEVEEELCDQFDIAELAIDWLQSSSLNFKRATKHPTEEGHRIWADYLYKEITNE